MTSAPGEKEQLWFLNTLVTIHVGEAEGTDGLSVIESLAPRGDSPPLHIHRTEDEIFHALDGEFRFTVGDEDIRIGAGETLLAPKGVPHTYRVESEQGRWLVVTARGDFERFVRAFSRSAKIPELPKPAPPPSPEEAETLTIAAREHEIDLVGPPLH